MSEMIEKTDYVMRQGRYIVRMLKKIKHGKLDRIALCVEGDEDAFITLMQYIKLYASRNGIRVFEPKDRQQKKKKKIDHVDENAIYIYYASEINIEDAYWYLEYHPGSVIILLDIELPIECKRISLIKDIVH